MKINKINDIKEFNIICDNLEQVKKCLDILKKLNLEIDYGFFIKKSDYLFISFEEYDGIFYNKNILVKNKNINFYDFKKETKKFLKPTIKENLQVEESIKEYKYLLDIANELNIENYELKLKLEDSYEVIKGFKSINKTLERILEISEKNLVKKDIDIEILKNKVNNE